MADNQDKAPLDAAGEHLVLSRLPSEGCLTALSLGGVRKADVLVNFLDGRQAFLLHIKAAGEPARHGWPHQQQHEPENDEGLFVGRRR